MYFARLYSCWSRLIINSKEVYFSFLRINILREHVWQWPDQDRHPTTDDDRCWHRPINPPLLSIITSVISTAACRTHLRTSPHSLLVTQRWPNLSTGLTARTVRLAGKVDELRQKLAVYYGLDLSSLPSDPVIQKRQWEHLREPREAWKHVPNCFRLCESAPRLLELHILGGNWDTETKFLVYW